MGPIWDPSGQPTYGITHIGITVRLGTVSVGAIRFMSFRNKYGRTLVNPNFCSADTWS